MIFSLYDYRRHQSVARHSAPLICVADGELLPVLKSRPFLAGGIEAMSRWASAAKQWQAAELLIDHGAEVNAIEDDGISAAQQLVKNPPACPGFCGSNIRQLLAASPLTADVLDRKPRVTFRSPGARIAGRGSARAGGLSNRDPW